MESLAPRREELGQPASRNRRPETRSEVPMADVVMPQMGESITEGTIVRWIKKPGDRVDRDEPLFEISTDKVDAEIPSPEAGILVEIRAKEGDTVPVNSVVAVIGDTLSVSVVSAGQEASAVSEPTGTAVHVTPTAVPGLVQTADEIRRQKSSPLVRRIAKEHHVEIARIAGTGLGGRVTKRDIVGFISGSSPAKVPPGESATGGSTLRVGKGVDVVPMSVMRRKIAEHMILSRRTSAHVHSLFEIDFTRVAKIRDAKKADYERLGTKLTFMSFILKATADALGAVPIVNASIDGDSIVYRKDINIGVAVALDWGLIVPVIRNADEKSVLELSRSLQDLATRARAKQLGPDEVRGGTFTVTNPGGIGALFGLPIINQPQVAIMGIGSIEKRVAVIDDAIGIRLKGYVTLGFDHRLIDGAVADTFMAHVKRSIETVESA
jgi:pyruvate dehydrogenase E2 component (dihydrolipoamide acetyltransferase)